MLQYANGKTLLTSIYPSIQEVTRRNDKNRHYALKTYQETEMSCMNLKQYSYIFSFKKSRKAQRQEIPILKQCATGILQSTCLQLDILTIYLS